jgi:RNA polymerase sigma factor (sigma-70 family)
MDQRSGSAVRARIDDARNLGDEELVWAMRRGTSAAFREFLRRFQPLLAACARRAGLDAEERDDAVADLLGDAATTLARQAGQPPKSLAAYLLTAFRHRLLNQLRSGERRARRHDAAAHDDGGTIAVASTCSESALNASRGPAADDAPLAPVLARLARELDGSLTADERLMLVWVSHHVPQREIAAWMNLSYAAATQRIWRLRERLRDRAVAFAAGLPPDERAVAERFFQRARTASQETGR